jgi:DNA-binding transcriptional LysR family regulator
MSVFVAVVEAGSLSGAARRLGAPLTTVSRRIGELEAHLKTPLFHRSTRSMRLTEVGRSYVAGCKRILEGVDEIERAASGEYNAPKGELIIAAPIAFGRLNVVPVVAAFLKAYPDIDVRLVLADRMADLFEDNVDLAVRIGELPDSSLMTKRVGEVRRIVCGSPAYFAARGIPRHPRDLAVHDCITCEGLVSPDAWIFRFGKSDASVKVHSRLLSNTAEAAIEACMANVGIARVLSYQVAGALRAGTLVAALENFEPAPLPVSFVYPGRSPLPQKLRAFLDFAGPRLRAET